MIARILAASLLLAGCGSSGYSGSDLGDGGESVPIEFADSGAPLTPPVPPPLSCQAQPHSQSTACQRVGSPYQFTCDKPPQGPGCKSVSVGSATHMSVIFCCPNPSYP